MACLKISVREESLLTHSVGKSSLNTKFQMTYPKILYPLLLLVVLVGGACGPRDPAKRAQKVIAAVTNKVEAKVLQEWAVLTLEQNPIGTFITNGPMVDVFRSLDLDVIACGVGMDVHTKAKCVYLDFELSQVGKESLVMGYPDLKLNDFGYRVKVADGVIYTYDWSHGRPYP